MKDVFGQDRSIRCLNCTQRTAAPDYFGDVASDDYLAGLTALLEFAARGRIYLILNVRPFQGRDFIFSPPRRRGNAVNPDKIPEIFWQRFDDTLQFIASEKPSAHVVFAQMPDFRRCNLRNAVGTSHDFQYSV